MKFVGLWCAVVVLLATGVAHGFDQSSLIPELDEIGGSLTQLVATLASGSQLEEPYRQVSTAEELLIKMRKQIQAEQTTDQEQASKTQASLAADIASLEVTLERQRAMLAHLVELSDRFRANIGEAQSGVDETAGVRDLKEDELARIKSECKSIEDRYNQRVQAAHDDIAAVDEILGLVNSVDCADLEILLQKLALKTLPASAVSLLQVDQQTPPCDCHSLLQTGSTSDKANCNCDGNANTKLHDPTVEYSCPTRKHQVTELLTTLKELLYSAASQDAVTYHQSAKACEQDRHAQQHTIATIGDKLAVLKQDVKSVEAQLPNINSELDTVKASIAADENNLDTARTRAKSAQCQYDNRSAMRTKQMELIGLLLSHLHELMNSTYADLHAELRSGCPNECSGHGICFNKECECDSGYAGADCSVYTGPHACPFTPTAEPCLEKSCADVDFAHLATGSQCAAAVCNHCRANVTDRGCVSAPIALFCAEEDRRNGCSTLQCPTDPAEDACGPKRLVRTPFVGCCFSPLLDCEDKCAQVKCGDGVPKCPAGLAVRYPLRDCCFNAEVDCVDQCALEKCDAAEPVCPAGKQVRTPFAGCCFDPNLDCEDSCDAVVCEQDVLAVDVCRGLGKRWPGSNVGCCFNAADDCVLGDDRNQAGDRMALEALYDATSGASWVRKDEWRTEAWVCYWAGVECSGLPGDMRVTSISLTSNDLDGTIPPELRHLDALTHLDLADNKLNGPIPKQMSDLTNLQLLKLRNNRLTGDVPSELGELSSVQILDVGYNFLTGHLPPRFGDEDNMALSISCANNCMCDSCGPRRTPDDPLNPAGLTCPACL